MIPKFIGKGGKNINDLKTKIISSDNMNTGERIRVNISKDHKIRLKRLHFEFLKMNEEEGMGSEFVLITVEMDSKNRKESLNIVRDFVRQKLEEVHLSDHTNNSHSNGLINEDDW